MRVSMLILLLPAVILAQLDVAFMVADYDTRWSGAMEFVENDPRFDWVIWIGCENYTPSLDLMRRFDVIFTGGYTYLDQEEFGDNLADYVDGGGYVVCIFQTLYYYPGYYGFSGRWLKDEYAPYGPLPGDVFVQDYRDLNILEPEQPIFQGVSHLSGVEWHILLELRPGAREIADFTYYPGIAINADNTVVGLDYDCSTFGEWTGDGYLIMANAACWLAAHSDVRETSWGLIKAEFE